MQLFKIPNPPQDLTCNPEPEALAQRQTLLDVAETIKAVTTAEENNLAGQCGSAIQKMVKDTKAAGMDLRRPYNAAADLIKKCEDAFLAPLAPHLDRLGRLAAVYRQEQERVVAAERQKRAEEIARLQEQERKAAEDARLAAEKGDLVGSLMADIKTTALAAATDAAVALPPPVATKTAGQSFQDRVLGWELVDIWELYRARPDLCNPPTPKASAIKATCSPERPVPGLRLFWESKVSFKSR